jgi:hypothetical protein
VHLSVISEEAEDASSSSSDADDNDKDVDNENEDVSDGESSDEAVDTGLQTASGSYTSQWLPDEERRLLEHKKRRARAA